MSNLVPSPGNAMAETQGKIDFSCEGPHRVVVVVVCVYSRQANEDIIPN